MIKCRGCGEEIRPCGVPETNWGRENRRHDATWGNLNCCLLGWRHVATGLHGCAGVTIASPAPGSVIPEEAYQ